MNKVNPDFLKKLLATFRLEAEEHVRAMSAGVLHLEKVRDPENQRETIETVFREAHSLKGAARAVNLLEVEKLCQSLESVFAALKRQDTALSPPLFDLLHKAIDTLGILTTSADSEPARGGQLGVGELVQNLQNSLKGVFPLAPAESSPELPAGAPPPPMALKPVEDQPAREKKSSPEGMVRISTAKLDSLLLQAEELVSAKLAAGQRAVELREIDTAFSLWQRERAKARSDVRLAKADKETLRRGGNGGASAPARLRLPLTLSLLEPDETRAQSLESRISGLTKLAEQDHRALGRMVEDLLEDAKKVSMLPFSTFLEVFPKLVRDLSRDRGKEVELVVQGAEIEADRRILEEMKDPLVHLVRNCIDHGIEKPEERRRKNKPPSGTITVSISPRDGGKMEIFVADDGRGIEVEKVQRAALQLGLVTGEQDPLDEPAALSLIFQSGFSTSPIVSEISGRGLGLAIVREKVEKLGGSLSCESRAGHGATFRMSLPLTMATFRGVLVRQDECLFVFPVTNVERVVRINKAEVTTVENRETIRLDGQAVSLVRLAEALQLPPKTAPGDSDAPLLVVLLNSAGKRIGFVVDEVLKEQEVLVKGLGWPLSRVPNVSAVTILGTGKTVPILNVSDLMKSAVGAAGRSLTKAASGDQVQQKGRTILVADDSITARTLVKSILESAGYIVKTAFDGMDAWTALKSEEFDLLVSDVDMPRVSGFELTAKIRADKTFPELPVVLVTALESREDRERGIDVGASAYIVKQSFDQSNLLEVIERLL